MKQQLPPQPKFHLGQEFDVNMPIIYANKTAFTKVYYVRTPIKITGITRLPKQWGYEIYNFRTHKKLKVTERFLRLYITKEFVCES